VIESKLNSGQQPNSRLPKRSHIPMKHKATDSLPNSSAHMAATQVINVFFLLNLHRLLYYSVVLKVHVFCFVSR